MPYPIDYALFVLAILTLLLAAKLTRVRSETMLIMFFALLGLFSLVAMALIQVVQS